MTGMDEGMVFGLGWCLDTIFILLALLRFIKITRYDRDG
jgi:hypothetical protein